MTNDFIDDFSDALEKEKRGYLVVVHCQKTSPEAGAHVRFDLDEWPEPKNGSAKQQDVLEAIAAAFSADDHLFTILTEEQRQNVLGALDSLGTVLAKYGHTWTDGERAIYELAVAAVTKPE